MSEKFKEKIISLLRTRDEGKTICPSEILPETQKKNKSKMEDVRAAAIELANEGHIVITQRGSVIDPKNIKGPIRLRLTKS